MKKGRGRKRVKKKKKLHIERIMMDLFEKKHEFHAPVVYNLESHVKKLSRKDPETKRSGFEEEFDHMRMEDMEKLGEKVIEKNFPTTFAKENLDKNRYYDVPCTEKTRIRLLLNDAQKLHTTDYINANWVAGEEFNSKTQFISCQGPLPNTESAFWFMAYQYNVRCIIMLTKCVEKGITKCEKYWPEVNNTRRFKLTAYDEDYVDVTTETEGILEGSNNEVIVRNILLKGSDKKKKEVRFFQYVGWPDFGIPDNASSLRMLFKSFNDYHYVDSRYYPVIVHCSAGIGRTGSFCTISIILEQLDNILKSNNLKRPEMKYDVFGSVKKMREQRSGMVQRAVQYEFVYHTIYEEAKERGVVFGKVH